MVAAGRFGVEGEAELLVPVEGKAGPAEGVVTVAASFAVAGSGTSFAGLKSLGTSDAGLPGASPGTAPREAGERGALSDSSVLMSRSKGYLSGEGTPSRLAAPDAGVLWSRTGGLFAGALLFGRCCAERALASSSIPMMFFI